MDRPRTLPQALAEAARAGAGYCFVSATGETTRPYADVQRNAGHYADRTVTIDGTVTNSWGVPLLPYKFYKVDDGTGEMTVLSRGGYRIPVKGSHVKVKGVVRDVAVLGGTPLGLHLEEHSIDIKRR